MIEILLLSASVLIYALVIGVIALIMCAPFKTKRVGNFLILSGGVFGVIELGASALHFGALSGVFSVIHFLLILCYCVCLYAVITVTICHGKFYFKADEIWRVLRM